MTEYAHPEVLVSTDWVAEHGTDDNVRLVEVDVDTDTYVNLGHIAGAVGWSWTTQLCDTVRRDVIAKEDFETLMATSGIANDTTVVLYGDNNNWFAAWAFWQLKLYGHEDVRLMNGGGKKWVEDGRPLTSDPVSFPATEYTAQEPDPAIRAFLRDVQDAVAKRAVELVDVRSIQEFTGEILAPPGLPETCQRGGHIPGAKSITWTKTVNEDGTFKTFDELNALYTNAGIKGEKPVIAYCRIGERSSHSWFVLKYLLGHPDVKNYDGSWTEWGNLVGAPVEKGEASG